MPWAWRGAPAAVAALLLAACGGSVDDDALPAEVRFPNAAAQGIDAAGLDGARRAFANHPQVLCALVERNGVMVMEEYFRGRGPGDAFDVRSVTKSVTSILVGIALEEGRLRGLDQTIGDLLYPVVPDLEPAKARISIRHLLTMTSGLPWRELGSIEQDYFPWVSSPDPVRWILQRPLEHEPGRVWNYNTGASHLLSALLTEATGMTTRAYAEQRLFGPLETQVGAWPQDNRGYNFGGHGITLTGRAMVRIGRLLLDGGAYRGRRVVSADWVRESTAVRHSTGYTPATGSGYGYLWWIGRDDRTGQDFFFASGYGGQFIVNVPGRNTTIVVATEWGSASPTAANANWRQVLGVVTDTIFPSLR